MGTFIYKGDAEKVGSSNDRLDWGFVFETTPFENGSFGVSYLSDLADSDEEFLGDFNNRFEKRVPAVSAYTV